MTVRTEYELNLYTFEAWSGAVDTINRLKELDKIGEVEAMLEEIFPDGCTETELNDFLWFEDNMIAEWLGMSDLWYDAEDNDEE